MKIYALTDKGVNKDLNEDRVIVNKEIISDGKIETVLYDGIFAIADGVGGNNGGAKASQFVAEKLIDLIEVDNNSLRKINEDLLLSSIVEISNSNMATTLSGIQIKKDSCNLFSIGNTRVYILQGKVYLKQLTTDDSTLNYLLKTGQLSQSDITSFNRKNEITACFGGGNARYFKDMVSSIDSINNSFIITSDGIHDYIDIDQMEEIIRDFGISLDACECFKEIARLNGSTDDISIIIGCME